ncbi:MAG: hypothetical protein KDK65_06590, partial [Chlamydiia bacterium]|nr:hypothetical protein [Chlamydiia bacterium]
NRLREQKPRLSSERVMLNNNITLLERSIATLFNQLNQADISTFSEKRQIEIFNVADPTTQETLFRHLTDETVAKILNQATNSQWVQFAQNHPQKYYQIVCVKHREALNMYVPNEFTVVGQAWSRLSHAEKAAAIKEMSQDEVNQILSYKRDEHLSEIFDELVKQQPLPKEACVAVLRNMNRQVRSGVEEKHENICSQLDYQRFIA